MIVVLICNNPEVIWLRRSRDIPNVLKKSQKWKISELSSLDQLSVPFRIVLRAPEELGAHLWICFEAFHNFSFFSKKIFPPDFDFFLVAEGSWNLPQVSKSIQIAKFREIFSIFLNSGSKNRPKIEKS